MEKFHLSATATAPSLWNTRDARGFARSWRLSSSCQLVGKALITWIVSQPPRPTAMPEGKLRRWQGSQNAGRATAAWSTITRRPSDVALHRAMEFRSWRKGARFHPIHSPRGAMQVVNIGTAGWGISRASAEAFPRNGSGLERYATRFKVAEINSSFHRAHRPSTWARWRDSSPANFRFSVKLPKRITHELKLEDCAASLDQFLAEAHILKEKLAVLLIQLPPKLEFNLQVASHFFDDLTLKSSASLACEPRHPSWFGAEAEALLDQHQISRVAADPAVCPAASQPGGWTGLRYWRLHGSPVMYRSSYADRVHSYAELLLQEAGAHRQTWCIFDNTASSAAMSDALALSEEIEMLRGNRR